MSSALATQQSAALRPASQFDLSPQTFDQALTFSKYLADSDLVPKDFKGKPANCLIAMQWGAELGLKPLQAIQNIAIINGRPALWGDAVIALVRGSPACEYITESDDGTTAVCRVKRKGEDEQVRTFSIQDATTAGLAGKNTWAQYPKRMRQMRARAFALRDVFPDVLRGMPVAEELQDMAATAPTTAQGERHLGSAEVVSQALPTYDQAKFDHNCQKWAQSVADGQKTLAEVFTWLRAKATVTPAQKKQLSDAVEQLSKPEQAESQDLPEVDPEKLIADMQAATNLDHLYELGGLIDAVADPSLQANLTDQFDVRVAELEKP